ncbi:Uncharacterised protein [Klebsiella pneumoniae]|nr:Uncharacterised protein [Klebsiella pneumoniae]
MHIRRNDNIRPPLLKAFPCPGQYFGNNRQLSIRFGRQLFN